MIDIHCHILPALDDGAIDLEDSIAMARQAESDGIEVVCATPHIHPDHEIRISELSSRVSALNEELERRGIGVEIALGGEVAETILEGLGDEELREVSLGRNGRWLLVEPKPGPLGDWTVDTVKELAGRGFRTIVAHPERHPGVAFREQFEALVEHGALVQATAALVANGPAAPTLLDFAQHGLVHVLGSDAHSSHGGRPLRLSEGFSRLADIPYLREHLDWMKREGPAAVLRGEEIVPPFSPTK
jgi:protein-tyrosine phosphatase